MSLGVQIRADALRTLGFASISGTYTDIGVPLANSSVLIEVQNYTDVLCTFSFDGGLTDHFVVPSNGQVIYDGGSNRANNTNGLFFSIGTQLAVKGAPTLGNVYVTVFHPNG